MCKSQQPLHMNNKKHTMPLASYKRLRYIFQKYFCLESQSYKTWNSVILTDKFLWLEYIYERGKRIVLQMESQLFLSLTLSVRERKLKQINREKKKHKHFNGIEQFFFCH